MRSLKSNTASSTSADWVPPQVHEAIASADAASSAAESTDDISSSDEQSPRPTFSARYGKDGVAELEILADGPGHRYFRAPLSLGRILHSDPHNRATQVAYLRSTGGGLAQGDKQQIAVEVRSGAHLLLTTQTATRVHTMDSSFALQDTHLCVGDGGILEYLPDPVITSAHSRYVQRTLVDVTGGATAIVGDAFSAGRIAMGERHEADVVFLRSQLRQPAHSHNGIPDGGSSRMHPIFHEQALYQGRSALTAPINHGSYTAWANLWLVAPNSEEVAQVLDSWRNYPTETADSTAPQHVVVGASTFPENRGCWARFMGNSMEEVLRTQHEYWARARRIVLGVDAFDLRKM